MCGGGGCGGDTTHTRHNRRRHTPGCRTRWVSVPPPPPGSVPPVSWVPWGCGVGGGVPERLGQGGVISIISRPPTHTHSIPLDKAKSRRGLILPRVAVGTLRLRNMSVVIFKRLMMQFKISLECSPPTHPPAPTHTHTATTPPNTRPRCKGSWAACKPQIKPKRGGIGL